MIFAIQVSHPATQPPDPPEAEDLAQAIQAIYPMDTEDLILVWNHVPIRLSYKYDVSILIDDLLSLLTAVLGATDGEYTVHWGSDTFNAVWKLRWGNGKMHIESNWQSALGNYEGLLNSHPTLDVGYEDFIAEWKMLLEQLQADVASAQVEITDSTSLNKLQAIDSSIPRYGQLYSSDLTT